MRVIVYVKQVPDTTGVCLDPKINTLIREEVPSIINPDDKAAIETAPKIKNQSPDTHATVLLIGLPQVEDALRKALAMGADEAILLVDRAFGGADTWTTSCIIADALETIGDYDLIITGCQVIDGDTAQVSPQTTEHLNVPQVAYAEDLPVNGDTVTVKRQFEDRYHIVDVKTPCLVTALTELAEPRCMIIDGIFDAYEHDLKIWGLDDIKEHLGLVNTEFKGSPTEVKKSYPEQGKGVGVKLKDLSPERTTHVIIAKVKEKYII